MKNCLMFALLLGAAVGAGFGQSFVCPDDECHVAPYFMGTGGFVGMAAEGVDEVTFGVSCGGVVTSGEATPNNGLVSVYLGAGNGLACNAANGGKFEVRGLQDGGWYWITDAMNSAVASLVAKDALGNTAVMPTDPGSSDITLTRMEGGSSTLVKQASTGRIGILHHVLPEPEMEVEEMPHCMPMKSGTKWVSKETGCLLGDGRTKIAMTATVASGAHAGAMYTLGSDTVERPSTGSMTVGMGLWGNGTGRISTSTTEADIQKGWENLPGVTTRMPLDADFKVRVAEVAGEKSTADLADVGVTLTTKDAGKKKVTNIVKGAYPSGGPTETAVAALVKAKASDTFDPRGVNGSNPDSYSATGADDPNTRRIENGWGQMVVNGKATGPVVYCKQKRHESVADLAVLPEKRYGMGAAVGDDVTNFIDAVTNGIVKVPFSQPTAGELKVLKDASVFFWPGRTYDEQTNWVAAWNKQYSSSAIKTHRVWLKTNNIEGVVYRWVPVVECATEEGEETIKLTQGMTIGVSASHCGTSTNKSVKLELYAPLADTRTRNMHVFPVIAANGKAGSPAVNVAASNMLTITCPATSANRGRELLPDNSWSPFRR